MSQAFLTGLDHSESDRRWARKIIGDLLDVARIQTTALTVDPEPADLLLVVVEAADQFRSADARNLLDVDLPMALADRRRVIQVLGNLLANAAGYSPEGSPITMSALRDGVHVAVSVADRGRGKPAELLPELSASSRGCPARRRHRAATGRAWESVHFHPSGGGAVGDAGPRSCLHRFATHAPGPGPCRGRQPLGLAVRPVRPHQGGLRARRRAPPHRGGGVPPGTAGEGAAGERWHRAYERLPE